MNHFERQESASEENDSLESKKIIDNRFELLDLIGSGASSKVYRARNVLSGETVAIKILQESFADGTEEHRFMQEARIGGALAHPNIVGFKSMGKSADGKLYIVQEFLEGQTMQDLLASKKVLSPLELAEIVSNTARGLGYAHENGIVHRDIKPANIIIIKLEDGSISSKILDLGIARLVSPEKEQQLTRQGSILGSAAYMSPEQCRGEKAGPPSDIYGLGCIIYEALYGNLPFAGATDFETMNMQVNSTLSLPAQPKYPKAMEDLLKACLSKEPEKRPDAIELTNRFEKIAVHSSPKRKPAFSMKLALATFALIAMLGSAGFLLVTRNPSSTRKSDDLVSVSSLTLDKLIDQEKKAGSLGNTLEQYAINKRIIEMTDKQIQKEGKIGKTQERFVAASVIAHRNLMNLSCVSPEDVRKHTLSAINLAENVLGERHIQTYYTYQLAAIIETDKRKKLDYFRKAFRACQREAKIDTALQFASNLVQAGEPAEAALYETRCKPFLQEFNCPENQLRFEALHLINLYAAKERKSLTAVEARVLSLLERNQSNPGFCSFVCSKITDAAGIFDSSEASKWNLLALNYLLVRDTGSLELVELYRRQAEFFYMTGHYKESLEYASRGLNCKTKHEAVTISLLRAKARALAKLGRFEESRKELKEALELAQKNQGLSTQLYTREDLAAILMLEGKLDEAEQLSKETISLAEKTYPNHVAAAKNQLKAIERKRANLRKSTDLKN